MIKSFGEFICEYDSSQLTDKIDPNSSFSKFPEFQLKKSNKDKKKGDLNSAGEMTEFIYRNQGLSAKQIKIKVLDFPGGTTEDYMYNRGGRNIDKILTDVLMTPYVIRSNERPSRYYARLDTNMTIDEIKQKHRGQISGSKFGI